MDPHHFDADPDLDSHQNGNSDPDLHQDDADPHITGNTYLLSVLGGSQNNLPPLGSDRVVCSRRAVAAGCQWPPSLQTSAWATAFIITSNILNH